MVDVHVVVGAGQAGANAAVAMREAGFTGRVIMVGAEIHHPYERPPLSKAALIEEPTPATSFVHSATRYDTAGIELRLGVTATALDAQARRLSLDDGSVLAFDRLLLATGGRARRLAVPGAEHVHTIRTLEDALHLRPKLAPGQRVVCIGAGVIGLETAASARHRGCEVAVVEVAAHAMGRAMAPELARWVERLHRAHGVELHFGASVVAVEPGRVLLGNGAALAADVVIAGVGMVRDTELAEAAGLEVDNGILVDECGRTGVSGIFAAGDVAAFWHPSLQRRLRLETWKHAQNHGIAVGRAMAGIAEPYVDVPWYWTDQHGVNIQVAGLPQDAVRSVLRGEETADSFSTWHFDTAGRVVCVSGVNAAREVRVGLALIERGAVVAPGVLADRSVKLQSLLKG